MTGIFTFGVKVKLGMEQNEKYTLQNKRKYDTLEPRSNRVAGWLDLHSKENGGGAHEEQIQFQRLDAVRIIFACTTDLHIFDQSLGST